MKPPEDRSLISAPAKGRSFKKVEWETEGIQVLCLPADGTAYSKIEINTIDTKLLGPDNMDKTENAVSEKWVKHVPDLRTIENSVFDWDHRSLVIANFFPDPQDYAEDARGYWCMYKCNEPKARLGFQNARKNKYFRDFKEARAFGDVYVFRLEDIAPDRFGRRKYARTWEVPDDDIALQIFVSLACCDSKRSKRIRIALE